MAALTVPGLAVIAEPRVSVIVPFLNAAPFLAEAIESVLAQTLDAWELVMVDDGSTDASPGIAAEYAAREPDRIRILQHEGRVNRGIAASRDLGFRKARASYLALLDADDIYEPRRLELHVACLDRDPALGVVISPDVYWRSWAGSRERHPESDDFVLGPAVVPGRRYEPPAFLLSHLLTRGAPFPAPVSVTFRREAILRLGAIPEGFRGHYEDQALFCRLLLSCPAFVLAEPMTRYRQHPGSLTHGNSPIESQPGSPAMLARARFLDWLRSELHRREPVPEEVDRWITSELAVAMSPPVAECSSIAGRVSVRDRALGTAKQLLPAAFRPPVMWLSRRLHRRRVRDRVMTLYARFQKLQRAGGVFADPGAIRSYWNERIHDTNLSDDPPGTVGFYAALDAYHLQKCDYLLRVVDFERWRARDVLEIGCGSGLDLVRFARAGAAVTGVDLSPRAIELARGYCRVASVEAGLAEADGASLPFADGSFDFVYCMGVLPFATDPAGIVAETHRVLRPGGEALFMVYNSRSWMAALARVSPKPHGHMDAPRFTLYRPADFARLLRPFMACRVSFERFPWGDNGRHGLAGAVSHIMAQGARVLPESWWRPYGWHMLAACRKAA